MSDPTQSACLLSAALLSSVAGMGWLAVSMPAHAQQVWGCVLSPVAVRALRGLGVGALLAALALCLLVDHASMASLVWVMSLAAAALIIALTLAWQPRRLCVLAPWVPAAGR